MRKPLMVDLYCGLGGWSEGGLAEGYEVIGFDIERHVYGAHRYPAQLVIQDVLTLHGSQFKDAALIVASPPCQAYSYRAMPWKRAKALPPPDNTLFETCFRIQREACEAAGHHIPLVVENVRGAQKWVGRARWNFGSFYLWGDVPALMPPIFRGNARLKTAEQWNIHRANFTGTQGWSGSDRKVPGLNWSNYGKPGYKAEAFNTTAEQHIKNNGGSWFNVAHNTTSGKGRNPVEQLARKGDGGSWFGGNDSVMRQGRSKSPSRKFASAMIAKIPLPLSQWIARCYYPCETVAA